MDDIGKYTKSFGVSLAITSILSAVLVVVKESSQDTILAAMKHLTGHHWVTHGLIALVVFFALGWGLARSGNGQGLKITPERLIAMIVGAVVLSGLIIAGFYLIEG